MTKLKRCANPECGKTFRPVRRSRLFCCYHCSADARGLVHHSEIRRCKNPDCPKMFATKCNTQLYCSRLCGGRHFRKMNPEVLRERALKRYYKNISTEEGLARERAKRKAYLDRNRERIHAYQNARHWANREKMNAASRAYNIKQAAKIKAANEIIKWAKEQGVYNG